MICDCCVLPDCDDRSPRCMVRRLAKEGRYKSNKGHEPTGEERTAANELWAIWKIGRMATLSEAQP